MNKPLVDQVKERRAYIISYLLDHPLAIAETLRIETGVTQQTMTRDLKILKGLGVIRLVWVRHQSAPAYVLTPEGVRLAKNWGMEEEQ